MKNALPRLLAPSSSSWALFSFKKVIPIDPLLEAASLYRQFINCEYHILAGKNQKQWELVLIFGPEHFYHLIGLQKLRDISPVISNPRSKKALFENILSGKVTYSDISSSKTLSYVGERLAYFNRMDELFLESIVLRFDPRKAYCTINADVLFFKNIDESYLHIFFKHFKENKYAPCTFFLDKTLKYVAMQEKFKVLDIKKVPVYQKSE